MKKPLKTPLAGVPPKKFRAPNFPGKIKMF